MLTDQPVNPAPAQKDPIYFPVSAAKFIALSLCSLGIYEFYWFYRHWKLERARTGQSLSPFWRAVFAPLFAYSLFTRIKEVGEGSSVPVGYSPGLLAAGYFALMGSWRLPDPFWLISLFTFLPLLPIRVAVATINLKHAPNSGTNARFSGRNIILVVAGGLLLALVILGTFLPEGAP